MTAIVHVDPVSTYDLIPQASTLAEQIANTDFAPTAFRNKPAAVMAAMLQGHELGIGPMASLAEIAVINGKPCMSAKLMRALVQRAGHDIYFKAKSNTRVIIAGRRKEWPEGREVEVAWSMDDAKAAGLAGGQNYRKYPRAMLAARATGEFCRDNFADVLGGISYTPEELSDGDLVADGDLAIDSRGDIDPEKPAGATRKAARRATAAKKAPAKKAAAPTPAPTPEPVDLPALPGEDGFDDEVADAEVIDVDADAIQARIDGLTPDDRQDLGAWWKQQGIPPLKSGDLTEAQAAAINDAIDTYVPGPDPSARDKKMWALVAETGWPVEDRDRFRRGVIQFVTGGRTESSKDLTDDEWTELFDGLEVVGSGSMELHLTADDEWVLRRAGGAS